MKIGKYEITDGAFLKMLYGGGLAYTSAIFTNLKNNSQALAEEATSELDKAIFESFGYSDPAIGSWDPFSILLHSTYLTSGILLVWAGKDIVDRNRKYRS